ncbi:MAG: hypothetical protein FJ340_05655 [Sphingomonadales bacterium]|nr:hypothetical protein [Sphingomonadales bacterium]
MIAVFLKRSPLNILLLLLFAVVVKIPLFTAPRLPVPDQQDGELYRSLLDGLRQTGVGTPLFFSFLSFSFLFVQALLLNFFFSKHKLLNQATDLPGMSYLLLTSLFPQWSYWSTPLFMNMAVLYLLFLLFKLYGQSEARSVLFNTGFLIGATSFFYPPFLVLILWVLPAVAIMRHFKLQEWMLAIVGLLSPFYFYGIWLFWNDRWPLQPFLVFTNWVLPSLREMAFWKAGAFFLLLLPLLAGLYQVQDNTRKMLIQVRRGWTVLFFLLLVTALMALFQEEASTGWMLGLIPLVFYHACFYLLTSFRVIPLLFFWLTFFYLLVGQFSGTGWKI